MANAILPQSGIYCIRNTINGKVYIGSAVNLKHRLKQHKSDLNVGKHCNKKLSNAWAKYGESAFTFEIIEIVHDKNELIAREQASIDLFNSAVKGYNIAPIAGSSLGRKLSEEHKSKVGKAHLGKKRTKETCAAISAAKIGSKRTLEQRLNMSIAAKNRKPASLEARSNMSAAQKGRKHTAETKAKLSSIRTGVKFSDEHRRKISEVQIGKKQSPESVAKRVAAIKRRKEQNAINC